MSAVLCRSICCYTVYNRYCNYDWWACLYAMQLLGNGLWSFHTPAFSYPYSTFVPRLCRWKIIPKLIVYLYSSLRQFIVKDVLVASYSDFYVKKCICYYMLKNIWANSFVVITNWENVWICSFTQVPNCYDFFLAQLNKQIGSVLAFSSNTLLWCKCNLVKVGWN
jgi:hypothetical protein